MANIPVSTAIDNLLKSTPSTTVTTAEALTALGAATKGDASIVAADLAPNAVIEAKIADGAVTTGKIGTSAVTSGKLAVGAAVGNIVDDTLPVAKVTGTLPVAKGGTGAATLTSGSVLVGAGTSAPTFVAPSTAGNVLTSNGTIWQSAPATGAAPTNAQVNTAIETAPATTLRSAKVIGYNRLNDDVPKELWRPYMKYVRKLSESLPPNSRSFRTVCLGDSVAVNIGSFMNKTAGFGGEYLNAALGSGVTFITDWAGNMGGTLLRLASAGNYVEFSPSGTHQAVGLVYKAKNAVGTLKLQYQENKTGNYIDCTNAWSVSPKVDAVSLSFGHVTISVRDHHQLNVGDTVTGTGIPASTTITAIPDPTAVISKTGTSTIGSVVVTLNSVTGLAIGMRCATGFANPRYIKEINFAANQITFTGESFGEVFTSQPLNFTGVSVTLSAAPTVTATNALTFRHADCGSNLGGGILDTNNSGTEVLAVAWIILPNSAAGANYYNIRVVNVSGVVDIVGAFFDNGAFGFAHSNTQAPTGHIGALFAVGGTSLAAHHSQTTQTTWNRILSTLDPEIITYKTANALTLNNLQTYWPDYATKLRNAAPNALLVVIGSHANNSHPTRDDAEMVACNNYWREYCATNDGALFIDMNANMPEYNLYPWSTDGLWYDGIHAYDGIDVTAIAVWDAVRPAVEAALRMQVGALRNKTRVFQGDANEVRLTGASVLSGGLRENTFSVVTEYSQDGLLVLRNNRSGIISTALSNVSGIGIKSTESTSQGNNTDGHLFLMSNGTKVTQWANQKGSYHGFGIPASGAKANNGHRWLCPSPLQGNSGFTIEQQAVGNSGQTAAQMNAKRILALDVQATDALEGVTVYSWHNDHTEYLGAQGTGATATAVLSNGTVPSVTVTNKGHSYLNTAPTISFTGGGGTGATATATIGSPNTLNAGKVTAINMNSFGSGYTSAPTVVITPAPIQSSRGASIKFTTESPENGVNYNIHTPINATEGTGDMKRVIGVIPSYVSAAIGEPLISAGDVYYDEAAKKVKVKLS